MDDSKAIVKTTWMTWCFFGGSPPAPQHHCIYFANSTFYYYFRESPFPPKPLYLLRKRDFAVKFWGVAKAETFIKNKFGEITSHWNIINLLSGCIQNHGLALDLEGIPWPNQHFWNPRIVKVCYLQWKLHRPKKHKKNHAFSHSNSGWGGFHFA